MKPKLDDILKELAATAVPKNVLADAIELAYAAGKEAGELEAYDHYCQGIGKPPGAYKCHVLVCQIERLLRVNRYLWSLLPGHYVGCQPLRKRREIFLCEQHKRAEMKS